MNKQQIYETQTSGYRDDSFLGLTAAPHEVGLSADRLERITRVVSSDGSDLA